MIIGKYKNNDLKNKTMILTYCDYKNEKKNSIQIIFNIYTMSD